MNVGIDAARRTAAPGARAGVAGMLAVLLLLVCHAAPAAARQAEGPAGNWQGAIELPGTALNVEVQLVAGADGWSGTISIPQQNFRDGALSGVRVEGDSAIFAIAGIPGEPTFRGTLSEDGRTLAGAFIQGGQSFPFTLERVDDAAAQSAAARTGSHAPVVWAAQAGLTAGLGMVRGAEIPFAPAGMWAGFVSQPPSVTVRAKRALA